MPKYLDKAIMSSRLRDSRRAEPHSDILQAHHIGQAPMRMVENPRIRLLTLPMRLCWEASLSFRIAFELAQAYLLFLRTYNLVFRYL